DPLGGSYYAEATTDRLLRGMGDEVAAIERDGGALAAIQSGRMQHAIAEAAYRYQLDEEEGRRLVVGVNTPNSPVPSDPDFELHEHNDPAMRRKFDRLRRHRSERDATAVERELAALR